MERLATVVSSITPSISQPSRQPMADIVPIKSAGELPTLFDREADRVIPDRVLAWIGSDGVAEIRRPLTDAERAALERRASDLHRALVPWSNADRRQLEGELALMLGGFATMQRLDEIAAKGLVAQYLQLTRDRPFWAVVQVCRKIRIGDAGLPTQYCPNEAEFNSVLRRVVSPYERQLLQARRVLEAKVQPPPPLKLTRTELEAKLGRPLPQTVASNEVKSTPMPIGDGKHAERVLADLAARKARREAGLSATPNLRTWLKPFAASGAE